MKEISVILLLSNSYNCLPSQDSEHDEVFNSISFVRSGHGEVEHRVFPLYLTFSLKY